MNQDNIQGELGTRPQIIRAVLNSSKQADGTTTHATLLDPTT